MLEYISDCSKLYSFCEHINNIAAYKTEWLSISDDKVDKVCNFIQQLSISHMNTFLITLEPHGYYNKVHEYKKIWSKYPWAKEIKTGEEITYNYNVGVLYASIAQLDKNTIKYGANMLTSYQFTSALIFSEKDYLDFCNMKPLLDKLILPHIEETDNPDTIFLDFNVLISHCCNYDNAVIRYFDDGYMQEVACFVKNKYPSIV